MSLHVLDSRQFEPSAISYQKMPGIAVLTSQQLLRLHGAGTAGELRGDIEAAISVARSGFGHCPFAPGNVYE